jgi:hypothetical protein
MVRRQAVGTVETVADRETPPELPQVKAVGL